MDSQPLTILFVPDLYRDILEDCFWVFFEVEWPISIHDHVHLIYFAIDTRIEILYPFFIAP